MPRPFRYLPLLLLALLGACSHNVTPYKDDRGKLAVFGDKPLKTETGMASWYNDRRTASGERLDRTALTAAHKTLPFNSHVRVIDLKTGRSIIVRVNDRGPFIRGRIIDLTIGGARALGVYERGIAKVRIEELREIPLMTKPNLHSTPAQIRRDLAAANSAKPKASSAAPPKTTSSSAGAPKKTTASSASGTTRRPANTTHRAKHRPTHKPTTTKKKPLSTSSNN